MLVFAAIVIAVWWDKNHSEMPADGKRKVSFPWFMLGFIGASIIGTFVPFIGAIAPNLVDFAYIVLGMAMAALGINVKRHRQERTEGVPRQFHHVCAAYVLCGRSLSAVLLIGLANPIA